MNSNGFYQQERFYLLGWMLFSFTLTTQYTDRTSLNWKKSYFYSVSDIFQTGYQKLFKPLVNVFVMECLLSVRFHNPGWTKCIVVEAQKERGSLFQETLSE